MFDRYLRRLAEAWLAPIARAIGPGLAPEAVTWAAFAAGLGSAGAALAGEMAIGLALWILNRLLDGLDGALARLHGRTSPFGAYLDIVLDFAVYAAIPLAMTARAAAPLAFSGMLLASSFFVNAASWMYLAAILEQRREGAVARGESTTITMPPGLIAGFETIVFYAAFFVAPAYQRELFQTMAALVLVNVAIRLVGARRHLQLSAAGDAAQP
jgi:phosphatidylglycerophosphate synthase